MSEQQDLTEALESRVSGKTLESLRQSFRRVLKTPQKYDAAQNPDEISKGSSWKKALARAQKYNQSKPSNGSEASEASEASSSILVRTLKVLRRVDRAV